MAVNATQHFVTLDEVDETDEGGNHNFRWTCSCRSEGRWTPDKEAALKAGRAHVRRKVRARRENNATRLLRRSGLTLN